MKALFAALLLIATPVVAASQPGRLPDGIEPLAYRLAINPDAASLSFNGQIIIDIENARPESKVVLNALDLVIDNAVLDALPPAKVTYDAEAQTAALDFGKDFAAGKHRLVIDYRGKIYQSAAGLFALDYEDARGKQRMLATQFEPADARRIAPMWDEPARKAPWTVSITVPKGQQAIGNMPVATSVKVPGEKTLVSFQTTPKMSSYLLFLALGDIERVTTRVGKTEIGVVTRRGAGSQGKYALDAAAKLLPYYNDYFGTPYPLPKLDMIAGPGTSQFFGAMENWGAILYFERVLLVDPKLTTEADRQRIFVVVAHEMAHQWFGDLVTPRWWDDLWLNEGFASWMETKATDHFHPEWKLPAQVVAGGRDEAFGLDAISTTHPIIQSIKSVDEANQAFDRITYKKGDAVVRMIESYIGADGFREGVRWYEKRYAYQNTVTDQLWSEIEGVTGKGITSFTADFTQQAGVPLIEVADVACAAGRTTAKLSQSRFYADDARRKVTRWTVPVRFTTVGGTETGKSFIRGDGRTIDVAGCGALVVNPDQTGYFRTRYDAASFAALAGSFARLPLADQLGLLSDAWALGIAGYGPAPAYLDLVAGLNAAADPLVWRSVAQRLEDIARRYPPGPQRQAFAAAARNLLQPAFQRIGWTGGSGPGIAMAREALIDALGDLGDPAVIAESSKRFDAWLANPASLDPELRAAVLAVVATNATQKQWDAIAKRAAATQNPLERQMLYPLLGQARDPAVSSRALAFALTGAASPPTRASIIRAVATERPGETFDWALANAAAVDTLVDAPSRSRYFPSLALSGSDAALAERVKTYAERSLASGSRGDANKAVATILTRAKVRTEALPEIDKWVAARALR